MRENSPFISKRAFQFIGISLVFLSIVLAVFWIKTSAAPYRFVNSTIESMGEPSQIAVWLGTWLLTLLPIIPIALLLRPFSAMPSLRDELQATKQTLFVPIEVRYADTIAKAAKIPAEQLATIKIRVWAWVLDRLVFPIAFMTLAIWVLASFFSAGLLTTLACVMPPVLIYAFARDTVSGQSLARRLLKIQVVDATTLQPIGFSQSIKRDFVLFRHSSQELTRLQTRADRRRLGDLQANTIVIKKE